MPSQDTNSLSLPDTGTDIAIVGLACRFPDARNETEFWENLRAGHESIRDVSDEEYLAAGGDSASVNDPDLVRVESDFPQRDCFDAKFFGYSPAEAEVLDPQQRVLLECGYHALENAGYHASRYPGAIGVYAGSDESWYYLENLYPWLSGRSTTMASFSTQMANTPGLLPTRLSYHLGLRGPSVFVQTTCSTSLVAVHMACQDLLSYAADMTLAGGVSINPALRRGYRYTPDGPLSPDGHCRAFSDDAAGMSEGNGAGLVVLKRLADALADRDHIRAVIKGTAINNDGNRKAGLFTPSVQGQMEVIVAAQELAQVSADGISYLEAHGTGTLVGDPIEVAALTEAFGRSTDRRGFCALGSVKTNLGHLVAAAGIASLIKTVLALEHQTIPPSLNFARPNPLIDFENTPFWVVTTATPWRSGDEPRRAGVSSFGFGGTNAHAIVQEAPSRPVVHRSPGWSILPLAAKTPEALNAMTQQLGAYLRAQPELSVADVTYTLQCRSGPFPHRSTTVCRSTEEAAVLLLGGGSDIGQAETEDRAVAFLFPGAGAHYERMGLGLYRTEPEYRTIIDRSAEILQPVLGYDLRAVLYPEQSDSPDGSTLLNRENTARHPAAYPAVVATEYALATLLRSRGVRPAGLFGHSLGEYTAACLAGVFSLEEVLPLVAERERLIASVGGLTLSLQLDAQQCTARYLTGQLSLTAINAPASCVVSGPAKEIRHLEAQLDADNVQHQRLRTPGAVHSALLDPVLEELAIAVGKVELREPQLPFVSSLTGTWITKEQATDQAYWVQHSRMTVQFAQGLTELHADTQPVLLEVGPSHGLAKLAQLQLGSDVRALTTMRHEHALYDDQQFLHRGIAQLWTYGVPIDWSTVTEQRGWRVPLPEYPFERKRFWVDAPKIRNGAEDSTGTRPRFFDQSAGSSSAVDSSTTADSAVEPESPALSAPPPVASRSELSRSSEAVACAGLLHGVSWHRCVDQIRLDPELIVQHSWVLFSDRSALARDFAEALSRHGAKPIVVVPGAQFQQVNDRSFELAPEQQEHYSLLLDALERDETTLHIVDFWTSLASAAGGLDLASTMGIAYGASRSTADIKLCVVTCGAFPITGGERLIPRSACTVAASRTLALELPQISTKVVDLDPAEVEGAGRTQLARALLAEFTHRGTADLIGHRMGHRWLRHFEQLDVATLSEPPLRPGGVYVITGGLGNVGLCTAEYLARQYRARLVLLGRSASDDQVPASLRSLGGEVVVRRADVADRVSVQNILQETQQRFGAIHGVIHAAGVPDGRIAPFVDRDNVVRALQAKVVGTCAVFDALCEIGATPDFVALFSSVVSLSGAAAHASYAAANAFLDTFAGYASRDLGIPTVSINWSRWRGLDEVGDAKLNPSLLMAGMDIDTALAAFSSCLAAAPLGQIVVSALAPDELRRVIEAEVISAVSAATLETEASDTATLDSGALDADTAPSIADPGQPESSLEHDITVIWEEALGVDGIGPHDSFFELGGHSLLALQIVQRCKERLNISVTIHQLFTTRTIAGLVQEITDKASQRETTQV